MKDCKKIDECCRGLGPRPARYNRPGQHEIAYRLDTHAGFMRRMLTRIHLEKVSKGSIQEAPLRLLNIKSSEDPIVAILDAWSMVADVLAFYQERIANEGFLRTATERRSVLELARSLGYELKPGRAASTYLVFNVDGASGSPRMVDVPAGTKVQSIPLPGDLPRTFETRNSIRARVEWNLLRPKATQAQNIAQGTRQLLVKDAGIGLNPGDVILFVGAERETDPESDSWEIRILEKVSARPKWDATLVAWSEPLKGTKEPRIFVLRESVCLFGYNAPGLKVVLQGPRSDYSSTDEEWPNLKLPFIDGTWLVDLDTVYPRLLQGSWIILSDPHTGERAYRVDKISTVFRSDFSMRSRVTRIKTDTQRDLSKISVREATVFLHSEPLVLAEALKKDLFEGDRIEFDSSVSGLESGHILIISGKRMRGQVRGSGLKMISPDGIEKTLGQGDSVRVISRRSISGEAEGIFWRFLDGDGFVGEVYCGTQDLDLTEAQADDEVISEAVSIRGVFNKDGRTVAVFEGPMRNTYDLATVAVFANVVCATHGETVQEVLGSGESTQINQRFPLKRTPLTFIPAMDHGVNCTLEVKVNDVVWKEALSFHHLDETSPSYIARIEDDGGTTIVFGDGKNGARLPTGIENVVAKYRYGIGPEGTVPAGSLTLLQARPRGIRSVTNPLPALGAESPESISDARRNAPRTILTLERIVSLKDYEDFVSAFPGIGKAQVKAFPMRSGRVVHITIATSNGSAIDPQSELIKSLLGAIEKAGNSLDRVEIGSYQLKTFSMEAGMLVDERYSFQKVHDHVKTTLKNEFSFENRDLGQHVSSSEAINCMHRVWGVIAVDLDRLEIDSGTIAGDIQRAAPLENASMKSGLEQSLPPANRYVPQGKVITGSSDANINYILRSKPARLVTRGETEEILPAELLLINSGQRGVILRDLRA